MQDPVAFHFSRGNCLLHFPRVVVRMEAILASEQIGSVVESFVNPTIINNECSSSISVIWDGDLTSQRDIACYRSITVRYVPG